MRFCRVMHFLTFTQNRPKRQERHLLQEFAPHPWSIPPVSHMPASLLPRAGTQIYQDGSCQNCQSSLSCAWAVPASPGGGPDPPGPLPGPSSTARQLSKSQNKWYLHNWPYSPLSSHLTNYCAPNLAAFEFVLLGRQIPRAAVGSSILLGKPQICQITSDPSILKRRVRNEVMRVRTFQ